MHLLELWSIEVSTQYFYSSYVSYDKKKITKALLVLSLLHDVKHNCNYIRLSRQGQQGQKLEVTYHKPDQKLLQCCSYCLRRI